jgi:cytochrome c oxidase cbb3-type subunit 3
MKFINYLSTIAGIDIFPMISLFVFFLFFAGLLVYVFSTDRQAINKLKNLPFDAEDTND